MRGPGSGDGVPAAIAPLADPVGALSGGRPGSIRAAAPGAALVTVSLEGLADGDLSDVEVLLRGPLPAAIFDRLLGRCPQPALGPLRDRRRGTRPDPRGRRARRCITNARGVFSEPIAEYVLMMILAIIRRLPQLLELQRERTWQPLEGRELARRHRRRGLHRSSRSRRWRSARRPVGELALGLRHERPIRCSRASTHHAARTSCRICWRERHGGPGSATDRGHEEPVRRRMLSTGAPGSWLINVARGGWSMSGRWSVPRGRTAGGAVLDAFGKSHLPPDSPLYWAAKPHRHAAHIVVEWPGARPEHRAVLREPRPLYAGEPLLNLVDPRGVLDRMQVAIVGLARSGKTTVFNTLTRGHAETGGFGGLTVNIGRGQGPGRPADPADGMLQAQARGARRCDLCRPACAAPGGRRARGRRYPGRPAGPTAHRRCPAPCGARLRRSVGGASRWVGRPWRDVERLELEFVLADLTVVEKRIDKLQTQRPARHARRARGQRARAGGARRSCRRCARARRIRDMELTEDEAKRVRGFRFLTEKPVCCCSTSARATSPGRRSGRGDFAELRAPPRSVEALSARIEMEIGQLDDEEADVFRTDLGLTESSLERVIRLSATGCWV